MLVLLKYNKEVEILHKVVSTIEKVALTNKKNLSQMSVIFLNSFSSNTCFDLFDVTSLFKYFHLLSKSIFFTKAAISFLHVKFACVYLAKKFSAVDLLNFGVVIYLSWSWSVIFIKISLIFVL